MVSVCIPVVSDHGLIEGCLDSLAGSRPSVDIEVVVVANGLDGNAFSVLRKRDDIVLVRSAVNAGFSGGNNLAASFASGRYLLLLNDDSVVEVGFIDRLLSAVERDPFAAAVGCKILSADGTIQEAGSVLWSDGWAAHVGAGLPADSTAYNYVRYVDYISANGLLVARHAWDAVGGLDERYFPAYYEDVDLCLALWHHGFRVAYEPGAQLRHLESQSTSTTFRNFLLIRNRAQLVTKWSTVLQNFSDHPDPIDDAAIDAAVQRAARVESTPSIDAHPLVSAVVSHDPSEGSPDPLSGAGESVAGSRIAADTDTASLRDLKFAEADARVGREYSEFLEFELARTRVALDETDAHLRRTVRTLEEMVQSSKEVEASLVRSLAEKDHYIDSLPSVRVKKWIIDRQRKPES